ncbi:MAG: amidohydrolase [Flavobacteriales bacterium]|nr:amidohydrolase [Flavobacteriales bacterium]
MSSITPQHIKKQTEEIINEVVAIRRYLHQHPELSFKEYNTAAYIQKKLTEWEIPFIAGIAETGILATIEGRNPSKKTITLRADIDALPIQEENNIDFCSKNHGVMHACGHDVHAACLLGAAKILFNHKEQFEGSVQLLFQPGEEKLPGGASLVIKEGVFANKAPASVLGQHVYPQLEVGKVGFKKGMYMASADELYLAVKGKGGHAALPSDYINPLLIASEILIRLNELFMNPQKRIVPNNIPTVLAFGKIEGKGATNVIPGEVKIEGTFRTFNEEWRKEAHQILKNTAHKIATEMGGDCDFNIEVGYPFLINDTTITEVAIEAAEEFLGKENVVDLDLRMTSEDFAFYTQLYPSCFYRLGVATKNSKNSGLHTPTFNIDESAINTGVGLFTWIALKLLEK